LRNEAAVWPETPAPKTTTFAIDTPGFQWF